VNTLFVDEFSNLLRVSFLLFHAIIFYYLAFWRIKLSSQMNRDIVSQFFTIIFLHLTLNIFIVFRSFIGNMYLCIITLNSLAIGTVLFYGYKKFLKLKVYYLLVPLVFSVLCLLTKNKVFPFFSLLLISLSYFHLVLLEKYSSEKLSNVVPGLIRNGLFLPFVFFGAYNLAISFYILTESLIFNLISTFFVFASLFMRFKVLYEKRLRNFVFYSLSFTILFYLLLYIGNEYIKSLRTTDEFQKNLTLQRLVLEIKDRISLYSNFIRVVALSNDLIESIDKGQTELNNYLSYLNQSLNTALVFFINKNGQVTGCSKEYREVMLHRDVSMRQYFQESIEGKLSIFLGRGLYTKRDDVRVSYPVYKNGVIIGVIVFQFDISEHFKKQVEIEDAFVMHYTGAILIGKDELKGKIIFNPPEKEIQRLYEHRFFGNDRVLSAGAKQVDEDVIEYDSKLLKIVKESITSEWYLASFIYLDKYENYKSILLLGLILLALVGHSIFIKNVENLRNLFLSLAEEVESKKISLNAMDTAVIYTDDREKITYLNEEALRLLQMPEEQVQDKKLSDLFVIEDFEIPEYKMFKAGDRKIPVIYSENTVIVENMTLGKVITMKDATEIIRSHELAKKFERTNLIARISSGIVHDFNNYLFAVTGNLSVLKESENTPSRLALIERMIEATKIMSNIIEELKDLRPDFVTKKERVNIVEIAHNCLDFLLNGGKIKSKLTTEGHIYDIFANPGQIYRIFQNLIVNAKQAMKDGGLIEIHISNIRNEGQIMGINRGDYVLIKVSDTGPGIPEEHIDKIFDPFFSLKKEGKGLGLSIVKNLIEKLEGKIEVESRLGEGTVFRIYLPGLK